jgi:aspartate/methionine/tyrosine aminotransferase
MTSSEPPFPAPGVILNAAQEIIRSENLNYTETAGMPLLREALAQKHDLEWGLPGITITTGTTEALFCVLAAILEPEDELLVPALTLRAHEAVGHFFSGTVQEYPISLDTKYAATADKIIESLSEKTRAILVNNPLLATGQMFDKNEFAKLSAYCEEHDIYILVDESFYEIRFNATNSCSFSGYADHVITFSSMTKLFSISGLRIGWLFAHPEITEAVNSVRYISSTCANTFSQRLALRMVSGLGDETKEKLLSILQNRRKLMFETLEDHDLTNYIHSEAGYFILLNISSALKNKMSDLRFSKILREEYGILVTPGSHFGPLAEAYIRISFAIEESDIQKGLAGIRACVNAINSDK